MDRAQAEQLKATLEADPEIMALMHAPEPGESRTEAGVAAGLDYPLGHGTLKACPLHAFIWLAMIGSPLLGRIDELTDADIYRALWVLAGGKEALRPIMGLDMRLRQAETYKADVEKNPELYGVWLKHIDEIQAAAWREFDDQAGENAKQYGPVTVQEIMNVITACLMDARAGFDMLPKTADGNRPGGKKNNSEASGWHIGKCLRGLILACSR